MVQDKRGLPGSTQAAGPGPFALTARSVLRAVAAGMAAAAASHGLEHKRDLRGLHCEASCNLCCILDALCPLLV